MANLFLTSLLAAGLMATTGMTSEEFISMTTEYGTDVICVAPMNVPECVGPMTQSIEGIEVNMFQETPECVGPMLNDVDSYILIQEYMEWLMKYYELDIDTKGAEALMLEGIKADNYKKFLCTWQTAGADYNYNDVQDAESYSEAVSDEYVDYYEGNSISGVSAECIEGDAISEGNADCINGNDVSEESDITTSIIDVDSILRCYID